MPSQTVEYAVTISVMEVYNDMVRDQLSDNGAGYRLEVKHSKDGKVFIPGLTSIQVSSAHIPAARACTLVQ